MKNKFFTRKFVPAAQIRRLWKGMVIFMDESRISRINELYHKSQAEGLTEEEKKEQAVLRSEYIAAIRGNLRGQLNNISIQEPDGSVTNLGEKYGSKGTH